MWRGDLVTKQKWCQLLWRH